jgi:non-ribosomal peptide synthetase component F
MNTTISNIVLTLFNLCLFRLTNQDDICIGMGVANRNHPDTENLIGFFVNVLPIRTRFSETMEFNHLLKQVIENTADAFDHQNYPFDLLVQKLNPNRYANRQPLFNVAYTFQNIEDVRATIIDPIGAPGRDFTIQFARLNPRTQKYESSTVRVRSE